MIYDHLFYFSYKVAERSRNFDDAPVFGGIVWVAIACALHLSTLVFLLEGIGYHTNLSFLSAASFFIYLYYRKNDRWKKIVEKYEKKKGLDKKARIHPLLVVLLYYFLSCLTLLVAALFRNGDWIFANI